MATLYRVPKELEGPIHERQGTFASYCRNLEDYVKAVREWAKKNGKGSDAGKTIRLPVAGEYAVYVVFAPTQVIHLNVRDLHFPHLDGLTKADIRQKVKEMEAIEAQFPKDIDES